MLTGLIGRSQGSAKVYDVDMFDEMDEVREFMGICPQHDVLFDLLTPREHLSIFYDFKGGDPDEAKKQESIDNMIDDVGLDIDQNKVACTLSGGNRRKLQVSMALIGGSKLIMLDEPTSGMDLGARRGLWDMLKKYKKDRIVILTTHYMDEADVLGDRIGIMGKGKLMCIGSSLFLKNRFGVGYKVTFVKENKRAHSELSSFLATYFKGVQPSNETSGEVTYMVPRDQTNNFKPFFEELDSKMKYYEIKSYGVAMTTLEEVFININDELHSHADDNDDSLEDSMEQKRANLINTKSDFSKHNSSGSDHSSFDANKDSEEGEEGEYLVRGSNCCETF
jgi:ATP-binding cassette subfamily A (ABC1) protein 3